MVNEKVENKENTKLYETELIEIFIFYFNFFFLF